MRIAVVVLLTSALFLISASVVEAQTGARTVALSGFTVRAPADSAWKLVVTRPTLAVLKRAGVQGPALLTASTITIDAVTDAQSFYRNAEAHQKAAFSRLEMLSVHYNSIRVKDTPCLRYDGMFRDPRTSAFLNTKGFICLHSTSTGNAVALRFKYMSTSKTPSDLENQLAVADRFLASLALSPATPP